jgi:hypothetical protein
VNLRHSVTSRSFVVPDRRHIPYVSLCFALRSCAVRSLMDERSRTPMAGTRRQTFATTQRSARH